MRLTAGENGLDWVFDHYQLDALFMVREGHHSLANMVGHPIGKLWQPPVLSQTLTGFPRYRPSRADERWGPDRCVLHRKKRRRRYSAVPYVSLYAFEHGRH
jgi:hypothetical protein